MKLITTLLFLAFSACAVESAPTFVCEDPHPAKCAEEAYGHCYDDLCIPAGCGVEYCVVAANNARRMMHEHGEEAAARAMMKCEVCE